MATAPRNCTHSNTREEPYMDGKGNVIGKHIVCNDCGMIIGTR